jgi:site-specific DNA-methyltransferase (adenine-specific)
MEETVGGIERADHILTDPPYLYIKTHDFDREWDEQLFFENAKRLLPDDGFIALFGRGTSFYRWNTRLAELGFIFKEEIVWDKRYTTAPCIALSRVHETVSLHTKKSGKIRRVKIPYIEQKQHDIGSIADNIRRIKKAVSTEIGLNEILLFLQSTEKNHRQTVLYSKGMKRIKHGMCYKKIGNGNRTIEILNGVINGMNEKSILKLTSNHYTQSHPTEKPVRLAERVLALISDPGDTVYDPFMGSGSFGIACINTGRKYIGSEMKPEYFDTARKRIEEAVNKLKKQPGLFPGTAGSAGAVREWGQEETV